MTGAYIDRSYVYAVARIRGAELKLLSGQEMNELTSSKSAGDVLRMLKEKGWGKDSDSTSEELLISERENLWTLIDELVPDRGIFDVFRLSGNYHNLKAAIKEAALDTEVPGIYQSECTIDTEALRSAVRERKFSDLPEGMPEAAEAALDSFLRSGDGQLCDIIIDKACLEAIEKAGKDSNEPFLMRYAELTVASADIKTAVRAAKTGKDEEFLRKAIAECDTLDENALISAALNGTEAICTYLANTDYADAVPTLSESPAAFERWCDNLIIKDMRSELLEPFGIGPIAAYILAKENEIKSVRIIFSGKENGFSEETIRERVRETYV